MILFVFFVVIAKVRFAFCPVRGVLHSRRLEAMPKPRTFQILIATDGSEQGTAAVSAVTTFPWPVGVRVRGLAGVAAAAKKILARRWPDAVIDGPTVDAIATCAERVNARAIVLGSRGHGPIARLLLGSTSLGVVRRMRHAARSVIAAQATAVAAAGAAEEKRVGQETAPVAATLRQAGWKVDVALRKGAPLHELLAATERARAQLLVVGARRPLGRGTAAPWQRRRGRVAPLPWCRSW